MNNNFDKLIILHEIFHAFGRLHEHNRLDREKYVSIDKANIDPNFFNQFLKLPNEFQSTYQIEYDYSSIMHYPANAFSIVPFDTTIKTVDEKFQSSLGQSAHPTFRDLKTLNMAYCQYIVIFKIMSSFKKNTKI